jgi:hypothetical protein
MIEAKQGGNSTTEAFKIVHKKKSFSQSKSKRKRGSEARERERESATKVLEWKLGNDILFPVIDGKANLADVSHADSSLRRALFPDDERTSFRVSDPVGR